MKVAGNPARKEVAKRYRETPKGERRERDREEREGEKEIKRQIVGSSFMITLCKFLPICHSLKCCL